tara:strand:- start:58 stop:306 length:249 start_codon:yes stop_codon:yes gene_type:complete
MLFDYYKKNACCMWCNRTQNPHPDYNEPIPTKIFLSFKKRKIELCLYCYEEENRNSDYDQNKFCNNLDDRYDTLNLIRSNSN